MKSIKENVHHKIIINKSEFICELIKITDYNKVLEKLENIRKKYKDATHYCYAYIIDDKKKSSDDGEPGGTAGVQIMDTLNMFDLNYVLCVVIRYFGGIKLGAGGLIRAYRKIVSDTLKQASLLELVDGFQIVVEIPYEKKKDLEYLLKDHYKKEYKENVIYTIECTKEIKDKIELNYKINNCITKKIEK